MFPSRRIAGFFCRLLLIYGLFILPWPGIRPAYAALYSAGGNLIFRSLIPGGTVRFHPAPEQAPAFDTHIHYVNLRSGGKSMDTISSRTGGYLLTAFLVSLVLATPLPWRRRLWALLSGLILVNVAVLCRLLVTVLHAFSGNDLSLLARTWPWEEILAAAFRFAGRDIVGLVMLPVFIWVLVSFRRADWVSWVQTDAQPVVKQKVSTPDSAQRAISLRRRR